MPPQSRDIDRIARLELGHLFMLERFDKAREPLQVRIGKIDEARKLTRDRTINRAG